MAEHRDYDAKRVGERIRFLRTSIGMSESELAALLEVPMSIVVQWEAGEKAIHADQLYYLAGMLNVNADFILGLSNTFSTDPDKRELSRVTGLNDGDIAALQQLMGFNGEASDEDVGIRSVALSMLLKPWPMFADLLDKLYHLKAVSELPIPELPSSLKGQISQDQMRLGLATIDNAEADLNDAKIQLMLSFRSLVNCVLGDSDKTEVFTKARIRFIQEATKFYEA